MKKLLLITILTPFIFAQEIVDKTLDSQVDASSSSVVAQRDIERLDAEAKKLYYEFKDIVSEFEGLRRYDNQLEKIVFSQEEEVIDILKQIESLDNVNKEILPFL